MNYDRERERREAVRAGERARNSLEKALNELNSARNWGVYDLLGGGRFLTTMIKHSRMERASDDIEEAKADLRNFSRELGDVREYTDVDLSTGDLWGFADWFCDGLLSDWIMQDRINEARGQVKQAIRKVDEILDRLA